MLAAAVCSSALAAAGARDVSGRVVDVQTGRPIARAAVSVALRKNAEPSVVLTGDEGEFHILNLPNGSVELVATRQGYLGSRSEDQTSFDVGPNTTLPFVTLRLMPESVIHGVVVSEGTPVPDTDILLMYANAKPEDVLRCQRADDTGAFRLGKLKAGRYFVAAVGNFAHAPKGMEYGKRYYPDVIQRSEAKWIDLEPGQDMELKIQLNATPTREIRGRLVPMASEARVRVDQEDWVRFIAEWNEESQTFRFYGLPSGEYTLRAWGELDGKQLSATQTIVIRDADINGLVLELQEHR